jgi:hypothetical protein
VNYSGASPAKNQQHVQYSSLNGNARPVNKDELNWLQQSRIMTKRTVSCSLDAPALNAASQIANGQMSMWFGDLSIPVNGGLCEFYSMTISTKLPQRFALPI